MFIPFFVPLLEIALWKYEIYVNFLIQFHFYASTQIMINENNTVSFDDSWNRLLYFI